MKNKFLILGLLLLTTGVFAAEDEVVLQDEQQAVQTPVEAQPALLPLDDVQEATQPEYASQPAAEAQPDLPQPDQAKLRGMRSAAAIVVNQEQEMPLYAKNTDVPMPIASITKLMTAMVILDSQLPLDEQITIDKEDVDALRGTRSKLKVGLTLSRKELLQLALMAS